VFKPNDPLPLTALLLIAFVLCAGCDSRPEQAASDPQPPQQPIAARPVTLQAPSPEKFLAAVFARYHNASSYHDRGVVRLVYRNGSREEAKVAPMQVWLDQNRLFVEAYDVRLWSDEKVITGSISDEVSGDYDAQVLQLDSNPGRPELPKLFADPILAQRISAGLAGPPPQLEWLFASSPMKSLFEPSNEFDFGRSETVDGRMCRSIEVRAGSEPFTFWIDERDGLIRRVNLPPIVAPPEPGQEPQTMALSLELTAATFSAPQSEPAMRPLPAHAKYVQRLIPLPPDQPSRILGTNPPSFQLKSKEFSVSEQGSDRDATIIMRFAADEASLISLATLTKWNNSIPAELHSRLRILVSVDPAALQDVPNELGVPAAIDQNQAAAKALQLTPGALTILNRDGQVSWIQDAVVPPTIVTLGAVVADVLEGVDVPSRVREQWTEQVRQYHQLLEQVAVKR
jgi:hypothetical protein